MYKCVYGRLHMQYKVEAFWFTNTEKYEMQPGKSHYQLLTLWR